MNIIVLQTIEKNKLQCQNKCKISSLSGRPKLYDQIHVQSDRDRTRCPGSVSLLTLRIISSSQGKAHIRPCRNQITKMNCNGWWLMTPLVRVVTSKSATAREINVTFASDDLLMYSVNVRGTLCHQALSTLGRWRKKIN